MRDILKSSEEEGWQVDTMVDTFVSPCPNTTPSQLRSRAPHHADKAHPGTAELASQKPHCSRTKGLRVTPLIQAFQAMQLGSRMWGMGTASLSAQGGWRWVTEPHQAAPVAKQTPLPTAPSCQRQPSPGASKGKKMLTWLFRTQLFHL